MGTWVVIGRRSLILASHQFLPQTAPPLPSTKAPAGLDCCPKVRAKPAMECVPLTHQGLIPLCLNKRADSTPHLLLSPQPFSWATKVREGESMCVWEREGWGSEQLWDLFVGRALWKWEYSNPCYGPSTSNGGAVHPSPTRLRNFFPPKHNFKNFAQTSWNKKQ